MTTLAAAVSIGDNQLTINAPMAAGSFPGWVKIDDELLNVGGEHFRTRTTLVLSQPATAAHDSGATVTYAGRPYDANFLAATGGNGLPAPMYFQPTQPTGDISDGSIWVATDDDNSVYTMQVYSSGAGGWTDKMHDFQIEGPEDTGTTVRVLAADNADAGSGGNVVITAGDASGLGDAGGNVTITSGAPGAGGAPGIIALTPQAGGSVTLNVAVVLPEVVSGGALPQVDPGVFGQLWVDPADSFRVKQSQGA